MGRYLDKRKESREILQIIADNLRRFRLAKGYSQSKMARLIFWGHGGKQLRHYRNLENNMRYSMRLSLLWWWADNLKTTPWDMLRELLKGSRWDDVPPHEPLPVHFTENRIHVACIQILLLVAQPIKISTLAKILIGRGRTTEAETSHIAKWVRESKYLVRHKDGTVSLGKISEQKIKNLEGTWGCRFERPTSSFSPPPP